MMFNAMNSRLIGVSSVLVDIFRILTILEINVKLWKVLI